MPSFELPGQDGLDQVKKFCLNFDGGNLVTLADGSFQVERLDGQGKAVGVYRFSADGVLEHYAGLDTAGKSSADLREFIKNKEIFGTVALGQRSKSKEQAA